MNTRTRTLAVLAVASACATAALAGPAIAAPTKVTVRVEGNTKTLFEGPVTTDGHPLTKDASGEHPCDGTNGGVNPTPGATMTAALDDATKLSGLDWEGSWSDDFQDFFVSAIGPDTQTESKFWGYALNGVPSSLGGCQAQVKKGDEVLYYLAGTVKGILHADGPKRVRAGKLARLKVVTYVTTFDSTGDSSTKVQPIKGASIGGKKTNSKGVVKFRFKKPGTKRLKARKAGSVRSNQLNVKVLPRG